MDYPKGFPQVGQKIKFHVLGGTIPLVETLVLSRGWDSGSCTLYIEACIHGEICKLIFDGNATKKWTRIESKSTQKSVEIEVSVIK